MIDFVYFTACYRCYVLAADSHEDMENWMRACACANYEYLRLTVLELQRQVDEHHKHKRRPVPAIRKSVEGSERAKNSGGASNDIGDNISSPSFLELHTEYGKRIEKLQQL